MSKWWISIPVWGEGYVKRFTEICLLHTLTALRELPNESQLVVHTDAPETLARHFGDVLLLPLPPGHGYEQFGKCHAEVLQLAAPGDRVAFLCADQILSRECFIAAERRFREGFKAIALLGHRTTAELWPAPPLSAERLNRWAMAHAHPIIRELFWETGKSRCPSILFFRRGSSIVMRAFGLGPIALVVDRPLSFTGTIDNDLASKYDKSEIHVVTAHNEMSCMTMDDPSRTHGTFNIPLTEEYVAAWAAAHTNEMHRWFFSHRIRIQGSRDCGDEEVCNRILELIPQYERLTPRWHSEPE